MSGSSQTQNQLKKSSIGVWGIVFFVVAAAAPLGATTGGGAMVFAMGGAGGPAWYLIAGIVLLLFAVGFATMSRYVTSAGGFAAFASRGLGRRVGHVMGGLAPLAYAGMLLGIYGQFGAFATDLFKNFWGVAVPWQVCTLAAIIFVAILAYLDIDLSAKVLGVLMILEVFILLIFDFVVLFKGGGQHGLNADAFRLGNIFTTSMAVPLLFAFGCYIGFEGTTIYGEEAKDPRKTVPRATYIAIVLIGVFYTFTMWAIGVAHGTANVQQTALDDPVNFVLGINTQFVGQWATDTMQVLILTSCFAVVLSFHNALARYLFSLGRAQFLPRVLGRTHAKHKSPHVASVSLSIFTLVVLGIFMIAGSDPMMVVYLWPVSVGTLGVLVLQAFGSAAVIGFFRRHEKGGLWKTLIAPLLGGLGLLVAIVLAFIYFDQLAGTSSAVARVLPWFVPLAMVAGLVLGFVRDRQGIKTDLGAEPSASEESSPEGRRAEAVVPVAAAKIAGTKVKE